MPVSGESPQQIQIIALQVVFLWSSQHFRSWVADSKAPFVQMEKLRPEREHLEVTHSKSQVRPRPEPAGCCCVAENCIGPETAAGHARGPGAQPSPARDSLGLCFLLRKMRRLGQSQVFKLLNFFEWQKYAFPSKPICKTERWGAIRLGWGYSPPA